MIILIWRHSLFFLSFIVLGGCQTPDMDLWNQVQPGMDKGEVLEIMGSPRTTERKKMQDRWIYWLYDKDNLNVRQVHFDQGKAVYVGAEPSVPEEQSAAYIDKKNAELETALIEEENQRRRLLKEDYEAWLNSGGREELAAKRASPPTNPTANTVDKGSTKNQSPTTVDSADSESAQ